MKLRQATEHDAEGTARVQVTSWNQTYVGMVPDEHLRTLVETLPDRIERHRTKIAKGDSIQLVAEDDAAEVVGWLAAGNARDKRLVDRGYTGEFYAIYLLKRVHRQGLGRGLMKMAADHLRQMGHDRAYVCALRENASAVRFYKSLGARVLFEEPLEIAGQMCPELTLGFETLEW